MRSAGTPVMGAAHSGPSGAHVRGQRVEADRVARDELRVVETFRRSMTDIIASASAASVPGRIRIISSDCAAASVSRTSIVTTWAPRRRAAARCGAVFGWLARLAPQSRTRRAWSRPCPPSCSPRGLPSAPGRSRRAPSRSSRGATTGSPRDSRSGGGGASRPASRSCSRRARAPTRARPPRGRPRASGRRPGRAPRPSWPGRQASSPRRARTSGWRSRRGIVDDLARRLAPDAEEPAAVGVVRIAPNLRSRPSSTRDEHPAERRDGSSWGTSCGSSAGRSPACPWPAVYWRGHRRRKHGAATRADLRKSRGGARCGSTSLETLHADGGRRAFDFVKVTTDDGLVGWSEYNETFGGSGLTALIRAPGARARRQGPARPRGARRAHAGAPPDVGGRRRPAGHRRDRERAPRRQGARARHPGLRAPGRAGPGPDPPLLVALRDVPGRLVAGAAAVRPCGRWTTSSASGARSWPAATRRSRPTCSCSATTRAPTTRASPAARAFPSSIPTGTSSAPSATSWRRSARAPASTSTSWST